MNQERSVALALGAACIAIGLGLGTRVAAAEELGQITVQAGPITKSVVGRSPTSGAPIENIALTRRVSYSDLDLRTHAGAQELEHRVRSTAKAACDQLDDLYPHTERYSADCTRKATDDAMAQVRVAIAAAEEQQRG